MRDYPILYSVKRELRKYSSWSVTWRFRVTRELLELITDIRDFTTLFYVILRRESDLSKIY